MPTPAPTITTIIPVLNGEAFLAAAIESILNQSYASAEILVIDGGSTDGTAHIARSFGENVRFEHQGSRKGLGGARNAGLARATGSLVAFLDADDTWSDDKLQRQVELLRSAPETSIVLGHTQKQQGEKQPDGKYHFKNWRDPELALSMGAALFRREIFSRIGVFDESHPFVCDWDWFMRAREAGVRIKTHPETVQYYRRHGKNMTEQEDEGNRDTLRMLQRSLMRRRVDGRGQAHSLPQLPGQSEEAGR